MNTENSFIKKYVLTSHESELMTAVRKTTHFRSFFTVCNKKLFCSPDQKSMCALNALAWTLKRMKTLSLTVHKKKAKESFY